MNILAIDTSCDETSSAVTNGRRVISNVVYSQVLLHKQWGGVVPSIAKRAHEERIDFVIHETLNKFLRYEKLNINATHNQHEFLAGAFRHIDAVAVTQGPGLAIALEVGIRKAKEYAVNYHKKLIGVNHLEGHLYSPLAENRAGNPQRDCHYPCLGLIVSGGHTDIVKITADITYRVLGETVDDAAGEALDKAAKMLGLGYPGGAVIERLAKDADNRDYYAFPRPMLRSNDLNFSFSGLKTSLYYYLQKVTDDERTAKIRQIASSYQEAVFDTIIRKTEKAILQTGINRLLVGGGVIDNSYLKYRLRKLIKKHKGTVLFPPLPYLSGDNAAMIGVVAHYKALKHLFVKDIEAFDRIPRMHL